MASPRRTASPFPGMDPYLEGYWESVHSVVVPLIALALNEVLPDDLVARPELRIAAGAVEDDGPNAGANPFADPLPRRDRKPDVRVVTSPAAADEDDRLFAADPQDGGLALLAPPQAVVVDVLDEEVTQKYVEIREADSGRVVTVIELLSPSNKHGEGREQFLAKRREFLLRDASFVEIDLVRGGGDWQAMFTERARLPRRAVATYRAVTRLPPRPHVGRRVILMPMPLREPLPTLPVPLREGEPPATLALQSLIDRTYHGTRSGQLIDYARPPDPPLDADDAAWAADLLAAETIVTE